MNLLNCEPHSVHQQAFSILNLIQIQRASHIHDVGLHELRMATGEELVGPLLVGCILALDNTLFIKRVLNNILAA